MAQSIDTAKRIINGTWGELWIDGDKIAECTACQLKVSKNKETVNLCGQFMEDSKAVSGAGFPCAAGTTSNPRLAYRSAAAIAEMILSVSG